MESTFLVHLAIMCLSRVLLIVFGVLPMAEHSFLLEHVIQQISQLAWLDRGPNPSLIKNRDRPYVDTPVDIVPL